MIESFKKYYIPFVAICGVLTVVFIFSLALAVTQTILIGLSIGLFITLLFGSIIFFGLRSSRTRRILETPAIKSEDDFILYVGNEKLMLTKEGMTIPFSLSSRTIILKAKEKGMDFVFVKWEEIKSWEIRNEGHVYETSFLSLIKRVPELILREKEFVAKVLSEVPCQVKVCTDSFKE